MGPAGEADQLAEGLQKLSVSSERVQAALAELEPEVKKQVETLYGLQTQHNELEQKFMEEKAKLEAKYKKLYEPLYKERSAVVSGLPVAKHAVEEGDTLESVATKLGVSVEKLSADNSLDAGSALQIGSTLRVIKEGTAGKGVPGFWLKAFRNHPVLTNTISEKDAKVLEFLVDVTCVEIGEESESFKLQFKFSANPFFKNEVLSKTFMVDKDRVSMSVDLERDEGTEIEWTCPATQNPTLKVMKKKAKPGKSNSKPETKTVQDASFFIFFQTKMPEDPDSIQEEEMDGIMEQLEMDYSMGSSVREEIIPHAVQWFTGEALDMYEAEDDDEFGDDDDGEDNDDDDDEDDDDAGDKPAAAGAQQPECKQQ